MTKRPDLPRFANLRDGGNMPQRGNIRAGLALFVAFAGLVFLGVGFGL
jgi:hypothetical protein